MTDFTDSIRRHMSSLSDSDLLEVLNSKSDEYTPEAIAIARDVATQRGGGERLAEKKRTERSARVDRIRNKINSYMAELIAQPSTQTIKGEAPVTALDGKLVLHPSHIEFKGTRYLLSDISHLYWSATEEIYAQSLAKVITIKIKLTIRFGNNQPDLTIKFNRTTLYKISKDAESLTELYLKLAKLTFAQRFMPYAKRLLSAGVIVYGGAKFRIDGVVEIGSQEFLIEDFEWEQYKLRMPAMLQPDRIFPVDSKYLKSAFINAILPPNRINPWIEVIEDSDVIRIIVEIINSGNVT